jgi:NAD+ kinase
VSAPPVPSATATGTAPPATRAVGLVPHRDRPVAHALAQQLTAWLVGSDVEVRVPVALAAAAGLEEYAVDAEGFAPGLDLAISLGGDGTMLYAVQLVYPSPVPLMGVNVGMLGYLSELEPEELEAWIPHLLAGEFEVSPRMMLAVDVESSGPVRGSFYALNEAVIEKLRSGHLIYLDVSINGTAFTSYAADGLIVATPTGSTAYSFSAGGPIASPDLRCIVLTPISPHMLFDRSLVLSEHEEVSFVVSNGRNVALTIDGRELGELCSGDRVTCRVAPEPLRLVSLRPRDFHQILKTKFSLPDR